jgi:hypothetical protein
MGHELTPDKIMQLGLGFWGSKTFLSAIELGVFTELAKGPQDGELLRTHLDLHPRGARDFFDALVSLGMLQLNNGQYANTPESELFLDRAKSSYIGGLLEMCLSAMTGLSMGVAKALALQFPWANYKSFVDAGGAQGCVPVQIALAHPHLAGGNFDLPVVGPIFEEYVQSFGLGRRLSFYPGDFFKDSLPCADMGHILHDWGLEEKRRLIAKAHATLPKGGALIVCEAIVDDQRRQNTFGLLMSLNMLIETQAGFDFTGADCSGWMRDAGFNETRVEPLCGPDSMVVGIK